MIKDNENSSLPWFLRMHVNISLFLFVLLDQTINDSDVHNVVLSYLVHNCFKDTVESFIASTGLKQAPDHLKDMDKRKRKNSILPSVSYMYNMI